MAPQAELAAVRTELVALPPMPKVPSLVDETPLAAVLPSGALRVRLSASESCVVHVLLLPRWASRPSISTRGVAQRAPSEAQLAAGLSHGGKPALAKLTVTLLKGFSEFDVELKPLPRGSPGDLRAYGEGELCVFALVEESVAALGGEDDGPLKGLRGTEAAAPRPSAPRYGAVVGPIIVERDAPAAGAAGGGGDEDDALSPRARLRQRGAQRAVPASTRVVYAVQPSADDEGEAGAAAGRPYVEGMETRRALEAFEHEASGRLLELRAEHSRMLEALEAAAAHLAADTSASSADHVALLASLRATTDALLRCDAENVAEEERRRKQAEREARPARSRKRAATMSVQSSSSGAGGSALADASTFSADPTDGGGGAEGITDGPASAAERRASRLQLLATPAAIDSGAESDTSVSEASALTPLKAEPAAGQPAAADEVQTASRSSAANTEPAADSPRPPAPLLKVSVLGPEADGADDATERDGDVPRRLVKLRPTPGRSPASSSPAAQESGHRWSPAAAT